MLETGIKAPEFSLMDQNGTLHTLNEYRGKKVILYFYSKDNTQGCTKEACGFSDLYPDFTEKGAVIIGGVSKATVHHTRSLKKNTIYHLHSFQIQNLLP